MQTLSKWKYLFTTQFLGVLNDNFLKNLICFISVFWLETDNKSLVITAASGLLVLPFVLFSPLAGRLAKTKSKQKIVELAKLAEIPIMVLAIFGFAVQSIFIVMFSVFLMGLQSTLYSPAKYGLIREVDGAEGISFGTGTMEMLSFVAVLLGTVLAGLVSDIGQEQILLLSIGLLGMAILGWLTSKKIVNQEPSKEENNNESINPIRFFVHNFRWAKGIKGLNSTILGLATFWLIGSMLQMNLIVHCPNNLDLSNTQTSVVIAFVAIGIGFGCWVAGLLSKNRVEIGLAPIGGIGLSICMSLIALVDLPTKGFIAVLIAGAFFSGLFKVPLNAWIQQRVEGTKLGDILAYNNLMVFLFILLSAGIFGLVESRLGTEYVFIVIALLSWLMSLVTLLRIPAMIVRFVFFLLANTFFKIDIKGKEHIPLKSGALLAANHVSFLDSFLIVAAAPRMVRFVMLKEIYENRLFHWWFKRFNIIPITSRLNKNDLDEFNQRCQEEINNGHIVCIFPEGQISKTGELNEFKKGIEHIGSGITAPIVPINMSNVIGSPFSYQLGTSKLFRMSIKSLRRKVTIHIGLPLSPETSAENVKKAVEALGVNA